MSGMELVTSSPAYMPVRQGAGTRGRRIPLYSNFFAVTCLPSADLHMYNVQITPAVPKAVNRIVMAALRDNVPDLFEGRLTFAYDGEATMYYPKRLSWQSRVETVDVPDRRDKFTVKLEHVAVVNMATLHEFLKGGDLDIPQDCVQALDVVLRTTPISTCTTIGSSFFSGRNTAPLDAGAEIWFGYHQSLRPAHGRLLVNLDVAATCFHRAQAVTDLIASVTRKPLEQIDESSRTAIRAELAGVKVCAKHRAGQKRKYRVHDIDKQNALEFVFDIEENGKLRKVNVAQYFEERYQVKLKYPNLPLLIVGNKSNGARLPMEVCDIVAGERIAKKLAPAQTAAMIKKTAAKPNIRLDSVNKAVAERSYPNDPALADFGIKVETSMVQIDGRVLDPPRIAYNQERSKQKFVVPKLGAWQFRDAHMYTTPAVDRWGVLVLEQRARENEVMNFLQMLNATAKDMGIMFQRPVIIPCPRGRPSGYQDIIMKAVKQVEDQAKGQCQLLMIILPFSDPSAYGEIKRVCDTVIDVPSQCMLSKHVQKADPMYARNILLKINARVGGINSILDSSPSTQFLFSKPAIVFGADVTHAAPFSKLPSLAAVVASMDAYPFRYECETRAQKNRQEIIQDLKGMAMNLLKRFYQATRGKKPERILFYRDGVSEGQFDHVLKYELNALREACNELESGYTPKITFVIVQKRHHARFFCTPQSSREADRSGNVPAGTVVDTAVVHPRQFDFYLVAHGGIQGTSRPTHYHVIFDENGFTPDLLQDLTYRQCYMYARCTRSVSLVPAAYYAHLAAFRARFHSKADEYEFQSGSSSDTSSASASSGIPTVMGRTGSQMYFI
ncbi:Argonaute linker 2 domain containing protein [Plasmodiophora brassicae]|uniref:Uncharacterized protein n=1 Tax=Plasmodiophora brassicae TaxID=37360 RepID=A0A0G4IM91_PLABS|nr:hypothetical protein PBRA_004940 [Plasmodiophora brassicae]SPQ99204.1 unnamed protein product [Plasmodiophora brassicae]